MNALICGQDNYIVIVCYQSILIERKTFTVTTSSSNSSRFRVCCLCGVTKDLQYGKPILSLNIFPNLIGISNNFRLYPTYLVNCYEKIQKLKNYFPDPLFDYLILGKIKITIYYPKKRVLCIVPLVIQR